jgi:AmmeMemoRadiSam system protein B
MRVRRPAVAGTFYPDDPEVLRSTVDAHVASGRSRIGGLDAAPKAVIVPHAGYIFSGPIAGSAYAALAPLARTVTRVVLLGPAHRVAVDGLAVPSVDAFLTPLGGVTIDAEARAIALSCAGVSVDDVAHAPEHSLEVQVPFLQQVLAPGFRVLPIVVGHASPAAVASMIDALWGGPETLFVVSSDLSHYEPYDVARAHDRRTAQAIVDGAIEEIGPYDACGVYPVRGLLAASARRDVGVHLVDLRNSGDTAGPPDRVVGYGAFVLTPPREEAA